jgi:hypothetical protein
MQNNVAIERHQRVAWHRAIASGVLVHAAVIAGLWWLMLYADVEVIPGTYWVVLAWAWFVWPVVVFAWRQASRLTVAALVVGALIMVPCASTIYTFTAWSINGFAP